MSFIDVKRGKMYAPGYFLAHDECTRETREVPATGDLVTTESNGSKYVKMGTIYPANNGTAIGIVYEDVDVSTGAMPASIVTKGEVIESRLHTAPEAAAKTALEGLGFKFVTEGAVTRPDWT